MQVMSVTTKNTTLLPVQEDEELYVRQSQMMRAICRLKQLQWHPRKLAGKKMKITNTANSTDTHQTFPVQKAYPLNTEC